MPVLVGGRSLVGRSKIQVMKYPWVNILLLILISFLLVSGFFGLFYGVPSYGWIMNLHGLAGFSVILLLLWKGIIILDVYQRGTGFGFRRSGFLLLLLVLLTILGSGLYWSTIGQVYLFGMSLITLHILLAISLLGLFIWHTWAMRFIIKIPGSLDRRALLHSGLVTLGGLVFWRAALGVEGAADLPGADRRFTGSYEAGSHGGSFPSVSWLTDRPEPIVPDSWMLLVTGLVESPAIFTIDSLMEFTPTERIATLDCTGGWFTEQVWSGVLLADLYELVGVRSSALSVRFQSSTGYNRKFNLSDARDFILATHVSGQVLDHGHGFPARLVASGHRGFAWVKWLERIEFDRMPAIYQPVLPLQ
jgi:Oxidoreductase molybdopterin binding domain